MTDKKKPLPSNSERLEIQETQENMVKKNVEPETDNQEGYVNIKEEKEILHTQQTVMVDQLYAKLKDETAEKIALSNTLPATLKPYATEIYYYQLFDDAFVDMRDMSVSIKKQRKELFSSLKAWYISQMKHDFPQDREKKIQTTLQGFVSRKNNINELTNYINKTMFAEYADRLESRDIDGTNQNVQNQVKGLRSDIQKSQAYVDQGKMPTTMGFASNGYLPRRYWLYQDRTSAPK